MDGAFQRAAFLLVRLEWSEAGMGGGVLGGFGSGEFVDGKVRFVKSSGYLWGNCGTSTIVPS